MIKDIPINPIDGLKQLAEMWEKQLNGLLYMMTDNKEFVSAANIGLEAHSRYMEIFKKNQEMLAKMMNIPTKTDVANVAEMTIQAEGKIDTLEEHIWSLQDHLTTMKRENLEILQEIVQTTKQLRVEIQPIIHQLNEPKKKNIEYPEIRQTAIEMKILQVHMQELKNEIEGLKEFQEIKENRYLQEIEMLHSELDGIKKGLSQIADLKKEITSLKNLMKKEKELVLSGAGTAK